MEKNTPEKSPIERVKKNETHTVWGGYKRHSPLHLASWLSGGCLIALVVFLLLLGLLAAVYYRFMQPIAL